MKLTSGKNSTTLLLIVLVAALLFALYYYVIKPKKEEVAFIENSIVATQSEIALLEEQIAQMNESKSLDQATLTQMRKKVPAKRDLEDLVLNIEETQYVSGTRVLGVNFNNYDSLVSEAELGPSKEEEGTEESTEEAATTEENSTESEGTETEETPESTISKDSLPPELKLITFEIQVASPDFNHLVSFIREVEKIERIMHIDIIEFSLPGEENEFAENPQESIEATIQVTTFYYEGEE